MTEKLKSLLEKTRDHEMTPEEREAQAIDFSYGNAKYENDEITLEGIIRASAALKADGDHQQSEP